MIFFRIDLSSKHGLGHYNRIKSLINYLDLKKYKIIVDKLPNTSFFKNEKKNIIALYKDDSYFISEKNDASIFLKIVKSKHNNLIVIKDSYRLGFKWEKHIYKYCKKLISIDDFPESKHFVDYYINHSPSFSKKNNQVLQVLKKNNKKNCNFLLGPSYALFNSTYSKKKKIISDFIFYNGGSGNLLIYEKIIKKLCKIKKTPFKIILIVGPFAKNHKTVCQKFKQQKNVKIIHQPESILNALIGTKVFISSSGVSVFESSFLKIPSLLFKMNINQNLLDSDYEQLGHYFNLKKNDLNSYDKIANLAILMMKNKIQIQRMMSKTIINKKTIKNNYQKILKL